MVQGLDKKFWDGKRVLVTGHTGFKGSWLLHILSELNAKIFGISKAAEHYEDIFNRTKAHNLAENYFFDITHLNALKEAVEIIEPQIIIHMAAQPLVIKGYQQPITTFADNIMGTANLLSSALNIRSLEQILVITTDKVYRDLQTTLPYSENSIIGGDDPYSASKACCELVVASYRKSFYEQKGIFVSTARAGNVIGGGDWSQNRLIPDFFRSLFTGMSMTIRNPDQVRPWQHVLEPLVGYLMYIQRQSYAKGNIATELNFGPDQKQMTSVAELMNRFNNLQLQKIEMHLEPLTYKETSTLTLCSERAQSEIGWGPKLSLDSTVELTNEWYHASHNNDNMSEVTLNQIREYLE